MLEQVSRALQKVEENWDSSITWGTFALVAARILSLTNSREIQQLSLSLLAIIAMKWMAPLLRKATVAPSNEQRRQFVTSAVEATLTSILTFDLDLRASIMIQENTNFNLPKTSNMPVTRWKRLCHRCLPIVTSRIVDHGDAALTQQSDNHGLPTNLGLDGPESTARRTLG
jgi:hypothetical protein